MRERITVSDGTVNSALRRWLLKELQGDEKQNGVYHLIAHGVPTWEAYQRLVGMIMAYENVLESMNEAAKGTDEEAEEKVVLSRSGLN